MITGTQPPFRSSPWHALCVCGRRQLSKRQLETIQPVERKVEMRLIHHEVRPQVEVITVKCQGLHKRVISSLRRCAFFAVGRCKKGEECSYSHQDGPPTVTLVKPRAQPVHVPPRIHVPPAWLEEAEHAEQVDLGGSDDLNLISNDFNAQARRPTVFRGRPGRWPRPSLALRFRTGSASSFRWVTATR